MKNRLNDTIEFLPMLKLFIFIGCLLAFMSTITLVGAACEYDLEDKVQKYTLKNGLKVLIVERHFSPTVSLYISYKAGAVDEGNEYAGTAHFLEHMLFKGTESIGSRDIAKETAILNEINRTIKALDAEEMKGKQQDHSKAEQLKGQLEALQRKGKKLFVENEIDRLYTENGGEDMNAYTGYDLTTYYVSLPSNKIELWARIESDRMNNPVFRDFYPERNVVMEERRQTVESNPSRRLSEQFLATAFMVHPYRRPIIGWASDLRFLNLDYVKYFFKTYHAPNNTVITVVGDVNASEVIRLIRKYFGPIPRHEIPIAHITAEPAQEGKRRLELVSDANPELIIGYHKPTLPSFDDYVFDILDTILSSGRTSRLYTSLVKEKDIAVSVRTVNGLPGARYPNLFVFFVTPRYPHANSEVEAALNAEIEKIKREPVSERELAQAKNQMKTDFLRNLTANSGLAHMLSYYETVAGDYRYITNHIDMIEKITAEDIIKSARRYFTNENKTIAILARKE